MYIFSILGDKGPLILGLLGGMGWEVSLAGAKGRLVLTCPQRIVSGRGEDHDSSLRSRCDFIENEADCSERQLYYSS